MEETPAASLILRVERKVEPESVRQKRKRNSSPLSYVAVIARAILSSPRQRLPLSEIYSFIEERFPEFTENRVRWKNTVRHNLSLHDCFVRGEVAFNKKGCNWRIHPFFLAEFSRGDFSRHKLSQSPSLAWQFGYQASASSHSVPLAETPAIPRCSCESKGRILPPFQNWSPFCQTTENPQPYISHFPWGSSRVSVWNH